MAEKIKLSLDDVSCEEMEWFEEATGQDIFEALKPRAVIDEVTGMPVKDPDDPKGRPLMEARVTSRVFRGLVFIALRRKDPEIPLKTAMKSRLGDFELELEESTGEASEENPTVPDVPAT